MSIDKVEVMNQQGNLLTLYLEDTSNGYEVRDIDGLDPVTASIATSNFAGVEGEQFQSSTLPARNITIQLGYMPNYSLNQSIRSLRSNLYNFFMPQTEVVLAFYMLDGLVVHIRGMVESCRAPLFSKTPQTDISIMCFEPDFVDLNTVQIHDLFTTTDSVPQTIMVDGTSKTGLTSLTFTAARVLSEFTIYHTTPSGKLQTMLISAPLEIGDVVNMCTVKRQKSITVTRDDVTSSLLWAVSPDSTWVELENGANLFYLNASTTNPSPVLIDFNNRYGGL